jgi:crotonobetainyl-CoA:carnitine CoA-transferase CaiB-like acyl-CoA transferase
MSRRLAFCRFDKDSVREKEMPFPRASKALSRFTVLDLTRVRSGPTCVRQLADWGANVIKIETPPDLETGESARRSRATARISMNLHRNKRSITLNLKAPEGVADLQEAGARRPMSWSRTTGPTSRSGSASTTRR